MIDSIKYLKASGCDINYRSSMFYHINAKNIIPDGYLGKSPFFLEATLKDAMARGVGKHQQKISKT